MVSEPIELLAIPSPSLAAIGMQRWQVRAVPAYFDLRPSSGTFPAGWVLVDGRLVVDAPDYSARLFFDTGKGFSDMESMALPLSRKGTIHQLITLPVGLVGLRLQPMSSIGQFELSPITAKPIGVLERLWRMGYRLGWTLLHYPPRKCRYAGLTFRGILSDLAETYGSASSLRAYTAPLSYAEWINRFERPYRQQHAAMRRHIRHFKRRPRFIIVIPEGSLARSATAETLDSLRRQIYTDAVVYLLDTDVTASTKGSVANSKFAQDPCEANKRTNASGNVLIRSIVGKSAVASFLEQLNRYFAAEGAVDFFGIVGPSDTLPEHALYWFAWQAQVSPDAAILYSDEDHCTIDGQRTSPCFKPEWSPELLRSTNYFGRLVLYRGDVLALAGGLGIADITGDGHDLALRTSETLSTEGIEHIPTVLYHRSGANGAYITCNADAVQRHLVRQRIGGRVAEVRPGCCRVRYDLPETPPTVSILIPTRDALSLIRQCVASILERSTYLHYEIVVIDNQSEDPEALAYLGHLQENPAIRVLRYDHPFNYSAINNYAVCHARGDVLCLLNNDTEVITPDWLEEMLGRLLQDRVGVVGAKLYYPDERVQHAGVALGIGCADHLHRLIARGDPGYCHRAVLAQDFAAVTGACLMTWKSLYTGLGGLDEANLPVAFNDVDYCLRVREAGYRVVWTPYAELYHHESVSRGKDVTPAAQRRAQGETDFMRRRWRQVMLDSPFYHPALSYDRPDFSLSHAPLINWPWLT